MIVEYTGRQTTVTQKHRDQADACLKRIATMLGRTASAHVIFTVDKYRKIVEVTLSCGGQSMVALSESNEMATALHDALAKIEQQVVRSRQRTTTVLRHRTAGVKAASEIASGAAAMDSLSAAPAQG